MIEKLLGKFWGNDPHRNQRLIKCGRCGNEQYEPKVAVSSICKRCGNHLQIDKRGKVVAKGLTRSGANNLPPVPFWSDTPEVGIPREQTEYSVPVEVPTEEIPLFKEDSELEPADESDNSAPEEINGNPSEGRSSYQRAVRKRPVIPQPEERQRPNTGMSVLHYYREVICFECGHTHKANRKAKTTLCPKCGKEFTLSDVDVHDHRTKPIHTRGNLTIHKSGFLQAENNICNDLKLYGGLRGSVKCEDFFVSSNGSITGNIRCHHMFVEKKSVVNFPDPIFAEQVEIHGKVTGDIVCHGKVHIGMRGSVEGSVTAYSITMDEGAELAGSMSIMRKPVTVPTNHS